jgi:hypothetical protein
MSRPWLRCDAAPAPASRQRKDNGKTTESREQARLLRGWSRGRPIRGGWESARTRSIAEGEGGGGGGRCQLDKMRALGALCPNLVQAGVVGGWRHQVSGGSFLLCGNAQQLNFLAVAFARSECF